MTVVVQAFRPAVCPRRSGLLCQESNQLGVGRRELEPGEVGPRDPPHFLAVLREGRAEKFTPKEVQLDGSIGIGVCRRENFLADLNTDGQFLFQFS